MVGMAGSCALRIYPSQLKHGFLQECIPLCALFSQAKSYVWVYNRTVMMYVTTVWCRQKQIKCTFQSFGYKMQVSVQVGNSTHSHLHYKRQFLVLPLHSKQKTEQIGFTLVLVVQAEHIVSSEYCYCLQYTTICNFPITK